MNRLREAAQAVLDRWDSPRWEWHQGPTADLMANLRAALAEPVLEPVAWAVYDIKHGGSKTLHWPEQHSPNGDPSQFKAVPLYSAPPQRKPFDEHFEVNFCARCGKRTRDVHSCTPPPKL